MSWSGSMLFEAGTASHAGRLRIDNEDAFLVDPDVGLWAVADGMGGHDAGQLASATVVEALGRIGKGNSPADLLARCEAGILEANNRLLALAAERGTTIGTTLVALLAFGRHCACVWSGDSRIYRVRDGAITLLSHDHTEVQDLIDQRVLTDEEGRSWPRRNVITRAIGIGEDPELEIRQDMLSPGDLFILCSDGLTAHVDDQEILSTVANGAPQIVSDALVKLALHRGGSDNVTVVVVHCRGAAATLEETAVFTPETGLPA